MNNKILTNPQNYTDIADAIRTQNKTQTTYAPNEMGQAILDLPVGGGDVVNGIIEEYLASEEDIDANTFVEFVRNTYTIQNGQLLDSSNTFDNMQAIVYDEETIIVSYSMSSKLYASIIKIVGEEFILGSSVQISTGSSSGLVYRITQINETQFCFFHLLNGYGSIYATLCEINDNEINIVTAATYIGAATVYYGQKNFSAHQVGENKVVLIYGYYSSAPSSTSDTKVIAIYGRLVTIEENVISPGTAVSLTTNDYYYGSRIATTKVNDNEIYLIHTYRQKTLATSGYSTYPQSRILTISGDSLTLSAGTNLGLFNLSDSLPERMVCEKVDDSYINVASLSTTSVVVNVSRNGSNGSKITFDRHGARIILHEISNNKALLFLGGTNSYGTLCYELTIRNLEVSSGNTITISSVSYSGSGMGSTRNRDNIFLFYNFNSKGLMGRVINNPLKVIESQSSILGLTKSKCTPTEKGEVWVLNN